MSKCKVLTAVIVLRMLRLCPFSEKLFVVYMGYKTLKTAFQKVDIHRQLFRWIELMTEYDLEVSRMPNADNIEANKLRRRSNGGQKHRENEGKNLQEGLVATVCWTNHKFAGSGPQPPDVERLLIGEKARKTDPKKKTKISSSATKFVTCNCTLFRGRRMNCV